MQPASALRSLGEGRKVLAELVDFLLSRRGAKAAACALPAAVALTGLLKQCLGGPRRDRRLSSPLPPRILGLPLLGSTLSFIAQGPACFTKSLQKLGVVQAYLLGEWTVVCSGPASMHKVFMSEGTLVVEDWPEGTAQLLGPNALSTQSGSMHATQRRLMLQGFTPEALARYTPEIVAIIRKYLGQWIAKASVMGFDEMKAVTFEVAAVAFLHFQYSEEQAAALRTRFLEWTDALFLPTWMPGFKKGLLAREYILGVVEQSIKTRQESDNSTHKDLLQFMMDAKDPETGSKMTLPQLKDQALLQLFAGHDTTSSTIAAMMYYLGKHRDVLERAHQEQEEVRQRFYGEDEFSEAALSAMPYLDAVINECLRFAPPVSGNFRRAIKSFELPDGSGGQVQVPRGAKIHVSMVSSIQQMQIEHPERFMPERWLTGPLARKGLGGGMQHLDQGFAPFAAGKRKCLGFPLAELETRIFGALVLRHIDWTLKNPDASWTAFPIPKPRDGMPLEVSKR